LESLSTPGAQVSTEQSIPSSQFASIGVIKQPLSESEPFSPGEAEQESSVQEYLSSQELWTGSYTHPVPTSEPADAEQESAVQEYLSSQEVWTGW